MEAVLPVHDLAAAHTLATIRATPDAFWDRLPGAGMRSLREQLRHIALVRESIARCLAGEDTSGLGATFETSTWLDGGREALATAFEAHAARCHDLLARLDPSALDRPFETRFGNRTTPRNYLRVMLLEETHHRAQMTCTQRLFGLEPPEYPGRAWVELNVIDP